NIDKFIRTFSTYCNFPGINTWSYESNNKNNCYAVLETEDGIDMENHNESLHDRIQSMKSNINNMDVSKVTPTSTKYDSLTSLSSSDTNMDILDNISQEDKTPIDGPIVSKPLGNTDVENGQVVSNTGSDSVTEESANILKDNINVEVEVGSKNI